MTFMDLRYLSSSIKKYTHTFKIIFSGKDKYNPGWIIFMFSSDFGRSVSIFVDYRTCTYSAHG